MFTSDSKDFSVPQNDLLVEPNLGVEFVIPAGSGYHHVSACTP